MKRAWRIGLFLVAVMALVACKSKTPQITIVNPKAELSPAIVGEAMATMQIANKGGDDMLVSARTDVPGAKASFHVMQGRRMAAVDMVEIPGNRTLDFKMGSDHIMIEGLPRTMKEGAKLTLILVFEKSGEKRLPLTLQKAPSMDKMDMGGGHQM